MSVDNSAAEARRVDISTRRIRSRGIVSWSQLCTTAEEIRVP